jgi:hypothetical protein
MGDGSGREDLKHTLVHAIEEKAGHPKYKAGRRSIYEELERLLLETEFSAVLSIIDRGYSLIEDEPPTNQIARELWNFSQHLTSLAEEKHKEFAEKYPDWFNENLTLQVELTHPLNHPPSDQRSSEGKNTVMRQLSAYLTPYFITRTGIAEMIAQIFLYFYGKDYPEIDPKEVAGLL